MPALEQDDKGVQVDLQDLGYETSGKSENDREESSSTGRRLFETDTACLSAEWTLISHMERFSLYVCMRSERGQL